MPRLTAKMGEREVNWYKKELEEDKRKDEELANKIKELRKERNKSRLAKPQEKEQPEGKKRKMEDNRWLKVINKDPQKRQGTAENSEEKKERNVRRRLGDIMSYLGMHLEAPVPSVEEASQSVSNVESEQTYKPAGDLDATKPVKGASLPESKVEEDLTGEPGKSKDCLEAIAPSQPPSRVDKE